MHVSSGHIAELPRVKYEIGGTIRVGNYGLKAVFHGGFLKNPWKSLNPSTLPQNLRIVEANPKKVIKNLII